MSMVAGSERGVVSEDSTSRDCVGQSAEISECVQFLASSGVVRAHVEPPTLPSFESPLVFLFVVIILNITRVKWLISSVKDYVS